MESIKGRRRFQIAVRGVRSSGYDGEKSAGEKREGNQRIINRYGMGDFMKKTRLANIELLRIISMLFVVLLHYLGKGGTLLEWGNENFTGNTYLAWNLEAFALVAVNVYVLIGGYFLVESRFKLTRIIKLWLQIFFYSAGIWIILLLLGMVPDMYQGAYWTSMFLLPITSNHYWFAGTYIFMCLLAPFMGVAVRKMSKKQLQTCIIVMLVLFSRVWRIILPMSTPIDDRGYGILWFTTLFMIAGYIRLYVPTTGKWIKPLLVYIVSSAVLFFSLPIIGTVTQTIGKMEKYYNVFYEYNAPFTIIGAVALFLAFLNMNIRSEKCAKIINLFASGTFGVYLLHEHILLRDLWSRVWRVGDYYQTPQFVFHCITVVILVYLIGTLTDWLRQLLFKGVSKLFHLNRIEEKTRLIDEHFNDN